ncbi:MAG: hypothetical protein IJY61_08670 [Candidatus Gastranaerophilales bacterium]|nr:hypothetical protein [Candidatus Gastranaerophilales bacterium]
MINISQISSTNIARTYNNSSKYSYPVKDTITLSFKGKEEIDFDDEIDSPILDFFVKMKAKTDSKDIKKNADDIKKEALLEYRHSSSILSGKIKRILTAMLSPDEKIISKEGKSYLVEGQQKGLKSATTFVRNGRDIQIEHLDIFNPDSTKDVVIPNRENEVSFIRKGFKQIAPKSYLEQKTFTYKSGVLQTYYDNASRVNDGVSKSKTETKNNVYNFKNGQLVSFVPTATYSGNELHYDKKYIFENGKIKTYMIDVDVIRGEDEPRKRYDF